MRTRSDSDVLSAEEAGAVSMGAFKTDIREGDDEEQFGQAGGQAGKGR
jgi:hypothetical protein